MDANDPALNKADQVTNTGIFLLRVAAGLFFLLPGIWKFISPADFQSMLSELPAMMVPYQDTLFLLVAIAEILGGIVLIFGFNQRLLIPPLVVIILVASLYVVRFDMSSSIRVFSLLAHTMAAGIYVSLFFLGSGRWALDSDRDLFAGISQLRLGPVSRLMRDLVSGAGKNTGVFLLRASIAAPFLALAAFCFTGADHSSVPEEGWSRTLVFVLSLLGGLSALTGLKIRQMSWVLAGLTIAHLYFVAIPDAAISRIGLINLLLHGLMLTALYSLRLIQVGSDLEVSHILNSEVKNVVIIGGGFAGTSLAKRLERKLPRTHRVVLISEATYTTFNPLLAEIVGASVLPSHTIAPIRRMLRRSRFVLGHVTAVDMDGRRVNYEVDGEPCFIDFEHVVFALGSRANRSLMPGMEAHALPFKLIGDALDLRNRVIHQMELADQSDDPEERKRLGRFIVIGGGFSGAEVAGAVHDYIHGARRHYPRLQDADLGVTLIHGTDCLLPELPETLGKYATKSLGARGLDIHLSARVSDVHADGVTLKTGERIDGATIVNTIGTVPNPLVQRTGLPTDRGRIVASDDMSIADVAGAWALGDCALVPDGRGQMSVPTAQFAVKQGAHLAGNIARVVRGKSSRPFSYRSRGSMAGIGHLDGVASLFGIITLRGLPAWLLWRAYYLSLMPTVLRRTQIFFEWTWSMLFSADITALKFVTSREVDGDQDGMSDRAMSQPTRNVS
ncbi:MAG: FAD-dependent oxidoreductase [Pseudomonadota bacterium]